MARILVPLDGSEFAEAVLKDGLKLFEPEGTHLVLFHCVDLNKLYARVGHEPAQFYIEAERQNRLEKEAYLDGLISRLKEQGYSASFPMAIGDPVDTILQAALEEKVDVVVMATHGRSGIARLFVGSVTEGVLRRSRCLVLVVPNTGLKTDPFPGS